MSILEPQDLYRFRYRQGQKLASRDLCDQTEVEGHLRWWHNRAVHDAYGVADGYAVRAKSDLVLVRPGMAYDCFGRELLLQTMQVVTLPKHLPAEQGQLSLLISYKDGGDYPRKNETGSACLPLEAKPCPASLFGKGLVRVPSEPGLFDEIPLFLWQEPSQVKAVDGVVLAVVDYVVEGDMVKIEDITQQGKPVARPMARPHIANGATVAGETAWETWTETLESAVGGEPQTEGVGLQVWIDTSAAGFSTTPCYFSSLQGGPMGYDADPECFRSFGQSYLAPLTHVAEPSVDGFIFRLWLPIQGDSKNVETVANAAFTAGMNRAHAAYYRRRSVHIPLCLLYLIERVYGMSVCWLGIQHRAAAQTYLEEVRYGDF